MADTLNKHVSAGSRMLYPTLVDGIPRRCRVDLWHPAESAISEAVEEIEKMPADVLLTDAVILLAQAREKVADYLESIEVTVVGEAAALYRESGTASSTSTSQARSKNKES